ETAGGPQVRERVLLFVPLRSDGLEDLDILGATNRPDELGRERFRVGLPPGGQVLALRNVDALDADTTCREETGEILGELLSGRVAVARDDCDAVADDLGDLVGHRVRRREARAPDQDRVVTGGARRQAITRTLRNEDLLPARTARQVSQTGPRGTLRVRRSHPTHLRPVGQGTGLVAERDPRRVPEGNDQPRTAAQLGRVTEAQPPR